MNSSIIRFVDAHITQSCLNLLAEQGFHLWDTTADKTPWLSLVNLSQSQADNVESKLQCYPGKHQIALLEPEQTELASIAMQCGVQDYLLLPIDENQLCSLVQRLRRLELPNNELICAAPVSRQLLMLAHRAAITEATVLLTGESGTGKEPLARYIHRHSNRAEQPFVAINCAAIPESILESLLFGHVKGAFTGASHDQAGKFELANNGTLLLDEIGEMPLLLQAKLLRVLQEREVERLGSHKSIRLNIRVIAATNKDLRQAVEDGSFRQDLFYRLDVLPIKILPLRQRREDILPIAEHFLQRYKMLAGDQPCYFSEPARNQLLSHDWPGNVRELENTIQRALVMRRGQAIQSEELGLISPTCEQLASPNEQGLKASKRHAEFQYIIDTLKRHNGQRNRTAEALGMTTRALRYKLVQMREQGIDIDNILSQSGHAA
ncbi:sigma-54 interaction domain-containing protein [Shewanella fidelis]|uniref:Sigma-54 dependent transcriptional regulator n=1 Tax=Shewanella fidelis TaxID=173509 RepID=A0AAW8NSZ7_9GAMM|nr:sigma-54 dependent transcriptional regulator [Shewanella fidelis]MDR8525931.1 sigma-54 dependent transcriptional regulator [Shewanella fidelis]MDW4813881.1 sigma-54 dependent transcriptional regulator [Shewanella fidelis]MDW4817927.1 sigma-54 dependent transcriptional regulator [Shewanella fidelis]MDW4821994.1 sigma-54 dependent transcriptional regulator [Shewanella fidelis]MDW4826159.1 sigma-54 dependent transcriptional regulator [Shewanella fidelis]